LGGVGRGCWAELCRRGLVVARTEVVFDRIEAVLAVLGPQRELGPGFVDVPGLVRARGAGGGGSRSSC
jgi:hypothetical protein